MYSSTRTRPSRVERYVESRGPCLAPFQIRLHVGMRQTRPTARTRAGTTCTSIRVAPSSTNLSIINEHSESEVCLRLSFSIPVLNANPGLAFVRSPC